MSQVQTYTRRRDYSISKHRAVDGRSYHVKGHNKSLVCGPL